MRECQGESWKRACLYIAVLCAHLCLILCDFMDYSLPGSSAHGILQARILEQVAISYSKGYSQPRGWIHVSCVFYIGKWILYHCATWQAHLREKIKAIPTPSPSTEILFDNKHQASTRCQSLSRKYPQMSKKQAQPMKLQTRRRSLVHSQSQYGSDCDEV